MNKKDKYYAIIMDKYLDEKNLTKLESALLEEAKTYFTEKSKHNMGIGMLWDAYIFSGKNQNSWEEYAKIQKHINSYIEKYAKIKGKSTTDFELEFINYGRTELVYVLTDLTNSEKVTILAKQPIVEFGKVKEEVQNLVNLKKIDGLIVAPIDYYAENNQELYITPYIKQARCIASDSKWGMYIPEPFYRFENFTEQQEHIVNSCMIAKLVSLYDFENKKGIGSCKLGGGDFMLPKDWELEIPTIENTLNNLYLISAREMINCSFEEYLSIIRNEFSKVTINEDENTLKINIRGRVKMEESDIENGIELGKQIIRNREFNNSTFNESDDNIM